MPAPTLAARPAAVQAAPAKAAAAPVPTVPFMRAARDKSRLAFQLGPLAVGANQTPLQQQQIPAAGYLRQLRITIDAVTTANAATVAFQPDAPFNVLQNISLTSAGNDTLISTIDGFALAMENKYGAYGTGLSDPCADPNYALVSGSGATGGSFHFEVVIPFEIDTRDAFGAVVNQAANQTYLLSSTLNSLSQIYATAPTTAPQVTITCVEEYYSQPAESTPAGVAQATEPLGLGSLSLIQSQTPPNVSAGSLQRIGHVNVGNVVRHVIYILRDASGVRTEAGWPAITNFYVNTDLFFYKTKAQWRAQHAREYKLTGGISATPALNKLDNGVYILTDFMNSGAAGGAKVDCTANRNKFLVTGSSTALEIEAVNWGAAASQLQIFQNNIRPSSAQALYAAQTV